MLNIFTLNVALMTVRILGFPIYSFHPSSKNRFKKLVSTLKKSNYDVVMLQEITLHWQEKLNSDLKDKYPHVAQYTTNDIVPSELIILSKAPIADIRFMPYIRSTRFEKFGLSKGALEVNIDTPNKKYKVVTTHMVADGFFTPVTSSYVENLRNTQIEQLATKTNEYINAEPDRLVIIGGDFNSGPDASPRNYERLTKEFIDLFLLSKTNTDKNAEKYTWSKERDKNFWSRLTGPAYSSARMDTFYIPSSQKDLMSENLEIKIIPNDFSDHFGVECVITV